MSEQSAGSKLFSHFRFGVGSSTVPATAAAAEIIDMGQESDDSMRAKAIAELLSTERTFVSEMTVRSSCTAASC